MPLELRAPDLTLYHVTPKLKKTNPTLKKVESHSWGAEALISTAFDDGIGLEDERIPMSRRSSDGASLFRRTPEVGARTVGRVFCGVCELITKP